MPTPKLEDSLVEYSFTQEEYKAARFLNPLQISFLHTLKARLIKQKAFEILPGKELDYEYVKNSCVLEGRIEMIQELLDYHQDVIKEASDPTKHDDPNKVSELVDTTAARAAHLVNQF